ncbi:hypothetical protein ACJMK2_032662 [Sinanodonta woodiana]|uniref:Uncharacterized protein n=1 Tax=Sinanodonta woodiana TaxID=1069815 RepID=A0ABD3X2G4_SINWO
MASTYRLLVFISAMLDSMGFSRHIIDFRINNASHMNVLCALKEDYMTVSRRHIDPPTPQHTVLYTEDGDFHRGYTWLKVGHPGKMKRCVMQFMILMGMIQVVPYSMQLKQIAGPSQPILFGGQKSVNVYAFSHPDWPVQASPWMDRCRTNGWPPQTIVTAIVQSGCYVVPKGFIVSLSAHME